MKVGFFEERESVLSMTRLISFMLVLTGIIIALMSSAALIFKDSFALESGIQLIGFSISLILAGITTKIIQKSKEMLHLIKPVA